MTSEDLLLLNEAIKASTASRRSAPAVLIKDKNRDLRSSRSSMTTTKSFRKSSTVPKSQPVKPVKNLELQNSSKVVKENHNNKSKEKVITVSKRKREEKEKEKEKELLKLKSEPKNRNKQFRIEQESEEDSSEETKVKIKKKKISKKEDTKLKDSTKEVIESKNNKINTIETCSGTRKSPSVETSKNQKRNEMSELTPVPMPVIKSVAVSAAVSAAMTTVKVFDDEESFRGFTKKSVDLYQSNSKTSNLVNVIDEKINIIKTQNTLINSTIGLKDIKMSTSTFPCMKSSQEQTLDEKKVTTDVSVKLDPDLKVNHSQNFNLFIN